MFNERWESRPLPEIDVMIEGAVRVSPDQVRLDALFRSVAAVLPHYYGPLAALPMACSEDGLAFASEPVPDDELSRRRLCVLRDFAEIDDRRFHYPWMDDHYGRRHNIAKFEPARRLRAYD